jgi:glycosyltransferase involved in cell wall biosynthesis
MKIAIFSGFFLPHLGGVERYTAGLSTALAKLGHEVVIVTSNNAGEATHEQREYYSIYRLPVLGAAKERYPVPRVNSEYRRLIGEIEQENVDCFILNTRFHLTSLVGAKLGKRLRKPVLLIEHGTNHFTVGSAPLDFVGKYYEHALTWYLRRFVDKFYGVSKSCNAWLEHFGIKASGVFYNAIDATSAKHVKDLYSSSYPPGEVVISYAGRLIREKGIMNLLEAFRGVQQSSPQAKLKLAIAGDGDLLEAIKRDYPDPHIEILGKLDREHMMALYRRTDIFVHPSLYPEGLPTAILEAGLMGCAIIATPRGGTEEVIIDHKHGRIVDGSIESLRKSISELTSSPAERHACGTNIRERIESKFDWSVVASQVEKELKGFN